MYFLNYIIFYRETVTVYFYICVRWRSFVRRTSCSTFKLPSKLKLNSVNVLMWSFFLKWWSTCRLSGSLTNSDSVPVVDWEAYHPHVMSNVIQTMVYSVEVSITTRRVSYHPPPLRSFRSFFQPQSKKRFSINFSDLCFYKTPYN